MRILDRTLRQRPWLRLMTGALWLWAANAAAAPQFMNYQGRLTDSNGNPLTGTFSLSFSVWDTGPGAGGAELWSETQSLTSANGIISAQLGAVTPFTAGLVSSPNRWLEIKIGTNTALSPRQALASVPYALDAASLDNGAVTPPSVSSGVYASILLPAANLIGVLPDLNLDASSVTLQGNLFNGPNQLLQLTAAGKLPVSVFSAVAGAAVLTATQTFSGANAFLGSSVFLGSVTVGGVLSGSGAGLTGLNAAALSSGTVADARLDASSVTLRGNAFNGDNELVLLDGGGKLPSAVFSGSAALLASTQTFAGQNTFLNAALFASSAAFTASGAGVYSLAASSGILVGGAITAQAPGGVQGQFDPANANYLILRVNGEEVARLRP